MRWALPWSLPERGISNTNRVTFTDSEQVFEWISAHANFEKKTAGGEFTLERMKNMSAATRHPEQCAPLIHIAGSKGKGSLTAYITGILEKAGMRAARYMSPHIRNWRERIGIGNTFFDESVYVSSGNKLFAASAQHAPDATFFELMTLYFFLCARAASCEVMVVETGLGGRLDATNIAHPLLSVITLIEKEHTEYLGNTLALIAGEKAGIIKHDRPVILAAQQSEAYDVFVRATAEKESPLYYLPDIAQVEHIHVSVLGTSFSFRPTQEGFFTDIPAPLEFSVPTPGIVHAHNAALAVLAVKQAFPHIGAETLRSALSETALCARFEFLRDADNGVPFVVDGAHTESSAAALADTWMRLFGKDGILLFGCAADKNADAMATVLAPLFRRVVVTSPGAFRPGDPARAAAAFDAVRVGDNAFIPDTEQALEYAVALSEKENAPLLCTGSFYLAGEAVNFWEKQKQKSAGDGI